MKTLFISTASILFAAPVLASPVYYNPEVDYGKTVFYNDIGFENKFKNGGSFYLQGGPAVVLPDAGDQTTEFHAKTGLNFNVTENLSGYGEISALTSDEINLKEPLSVGTKVGFKYFF
jgi:hypothetical protein